MVWIIVIDQLKSDFLRKFPKSFVPNKTKGEVGGFNYLMKNGAYFPNAEYNLMQSMTFPGHAIIMSGPEPIKKRINKFIVSQMMNLIL